MVWERGGVVTSSLLPPPHTKLQTCLGFGGLGVALPPPSSPLRLVTSLEFGFAPLSPPPPLPGPIFFNFCVIFFFFFFVGLSSERTGGNRYPPSFPPNPNSSAASSKPVANKTATHNPVHPVNQTAQEVQKLKRYNGRTIYTCLQPQLTTRKQYSRSSGGSTDENMAALWKIWTRVWLFGAYFWMPLFEQQFILEKAVRRIYDTWRIIFGKMWDSYWIWLFGHISECHSSSSFSSWTRLWGEFMIREE